MNLGKLFFSSNGKSKPREIDLINFLEGELKKLTDAELKGKSLNLKERIKENSNLDDFLGEAFAYTREAAIRTLGQRHFDVQLWGGIVLHRGAIAEMTTGEGKTLSATAPAYLNALTGNGVHIITVNDYLAKRDAVGMGQIYNLLGLTVSCISHDSAFIYDPDWHVSKDGEALIDKERDATWNFLVQQEFLRPVSRREAYLADITYGTNHEFGFDYLRDNLVSNIETKVQRGHNFAIIDEVDSILIDEARTPLIISYPDNESSEFYKVFGRAVKNLVVKEDFIVDEKMKSVEIMEPGINKVEALTGVKDIYALENLRLVHYLEASLKAKALFERDKDYVVRDGEILIVDQFTGRLLAGRRYSSGLHQAIEAKEGVQVKEETKTIAQITIQNYFRLYKKLSGMTGTAQTSAEEFHKVYSLEVESIPTNRPLVRRNLPDLVYKNLKGKYSAIAEEVRSRNALGQPVLIGTVSIEKNEALGKLFKEEGIQFEILNAKNNEREGAIIAQAGKLGAITLATNLAGRGVDIILGGNPTNEEEARKVKEAGGLHIIGTERHEARRIDNQLRGRSGRQGDPGSSQFFLSLEDDLLRVFGGGKIQSLMEKFNLPDDVPIESGMVSNSIAQAQGRVEGINFDARHHLLEYDDVLNKQRLNFYSKRDKLLTTFNEDELKTFITDATTNYLNRLDEARVGTEDILNLLKGASIIPEGSTEIDLSDDSDMSLVKARDLVKARIDNYKNVIVVRQQLISVIDFLWMNHLEDIEALVESVRIRAYGQHDPLVEYRRDSYKLFKEMEANFEAWVFSNIFKLEPKEGELSVSQTEAPKQILVTDGKIGRNDPCPCGSGKKYKKCHRK